MKKSTKIYTLVLLLTQIILIALNAAPSLAAIEPDVVYLYRLSTFEGPVSVGTWSKVRIDSETNEVYVVSQDDVRIFNTTGMETFEFSSSLDEELNNETIADVFVKKNGDMIFLTNSYRDGQTLYSLVLANYRGEPISRITLKNLPPDLSRFVPNSMRSHNGLLYFANLVSMQVLVVDEQGVYKNHYDIAKMIKRASDDENDYSTMDVDDMFIGDFSVDSGGSILFTLPIYGSAFKLTPDQHLIRIGVRGGGAGKFSIPGSIMEDTHGNYLVTDTLRCVVLVFDKKGKFISEFGNRGYGGPGLIAPRGMAIDSADRLYISQSSIFGVSVFQLSYN